MHVITRNCRLWGRARAGSKSASSTCKPVSQQERGHNLQASRANLSVSKSPSQPGNLPISAYASEPASGPASKLARVPASEQLGSKCCKRAASECERVGCEGGCVGTRQRSRQRAGQRACLQLWMFLSRAAVAWPSLCAHCRGHAFHPSRPSREPCVTCR